MFERSIIKHKDLEVKVSDHANEAMLEILNNTVQGSEGGLRFQLKNIPARIAAYKDQIRFVSLYMKNKVTGTVGSCYRITGQGNLRYPSSYLRYLAISFGLPVGYFLEKKNREKLPKLKKKIHSSRRLLKFSASLICLI